jgi:DNA processing protein
MEIPLTLLAASIACGGNSTQLGRWLTHAGDIERLSHSGVIAQSNLSEKVVRQFRYALSKPPAQMLDALQAQSWTLCSILDDAYPALLKTISDPPGLLYVRGNIDLLSSPQIAIVGARGASTEGLGSAFRFAASIAASGFTITSGLALGIDTHAHRGALSHSRPQATQTSTQGQTIAVLGNGAGQIYPPRNRELAEQIIDANSTVVTEFPPGLSPRREHFPARNRIISGLSLATIVIEAAHHSGSLITARLAATQGREVFAMPGSIHNPLSKGCHQLLRDGANWLESLDDLRNAFPALQHTAAAADTNPKSNHRIKAQNAEHGASPKHAALMQYFISGLNSIDDLALRSGIPIDQLSQQLFDLELSGAVTRLPGGYSRQLA